MIPERALRKGSGFESVVFGVNIKLPSGWNAMSNGDFVMKRVGAAQEQFFASQAIVKRPLSGSTMVVLNSENLVPQVNPCEGEEFKAVERCERVFLRPWSDYVRAGPSEGGCVGWNDGENVSFDDLGNHRYRIFSKFFLITHEPQPISAGGRASAGFGRWPRSGGGSWPRGRSAC